MKKNLESRCLGWIFQFFELIVLAIASFRLTRLIVYDKITEFIRSPFLDDVEEKNENGEIEIYTIPKKGGLRGFIGELISCYWCTGVWTSLFLFVIYLQIPIIAIPIILVLAIAGIAALIETIVQQFLQ
ncbi:DUF1360 domain-containing protein [Bacillus sp. Bva_UNVM-123]|uniref:DUF1360 domain-containing protein n=1 Tax=Bacillus sp. Bva_UNVM-123 TaxID=2829798 RepID=UPI00391F041D